MTRATRAGLAVLAALSLMSATACGSDKAGEASSPTTLTVAEGAASVLPAPDPAQTLPPNDVGSLRALYDPALATLGVRLTRAELVSLTDNSYVPSNEGTHLALYVEPIGDYTNDQYVDNFWNLSALMTPDVFALWSGLESYDICQEPLPSVDDRPEPFPVTQLQLTRAAASQIDWVNGGLTDLLIAGTSKDVQVVVSHAIRDTPAYVSARDQAREVTGTTLPRSDFGASNEN